MDRKVIPFPKQKGTDFLANQPEVEQNITGEEETDQYVSRLRAASDELRHIAALFEISVKEVIADFTYIIVGDEIVSTLMGDDEEDNLD